MFGFVLSLELNCVLKVSDKDGVLPAQLIEGGPTSQLIQLTFTPRYVKVNMWTQLLVP